MRNRMIHGVVSAIITLSILVSMIAIPSGIVQAALPAISVGDRVAVTEYGDPLATRSSYSTSAGLIRYMYAGYEGKVISGPIYNEGFRWWYIHWVTGDYGWTADAYPGGVIYLQPLPGSGIYPSVTNNGLSYRVCVYIDAGNLAVRTDHSTGSTLVTRKSVGSRGWTTADGPYVSTSEEMVWWYIEWDDGVEGWSADSRADYEAGVYLYKEGSTPLPSAGDVSVATYSATSVGETQATLRGAITDFNNNSAAYIRFAYRPSGGSWSYTSWSYRTTTTTYSQTVYGLNPDTNYEFNAQGYGTEDTTTIIGITLTFHTASTPPGDVSVATYSATSVGETQATLRGAITDFNNNSAAYIRFAYRPSGGSWSYTSWSYRTTTTIYSQTVYGLNPDTNYEFCAQGYGTEDTTTITGTTQYFTTLPQEPEPGDVSVATYAATSIGETQATLRGAITDFNNNPAAYIRFGYRPSGDSWSYTSWAYRTTTTTYSQTVYGLNPDTNYEFNAQGYGTEDTTTIIGTTQYFTTLPQETLLSARIDSYSPSTKITVPTGTPFNLKVWFTNTGDTNYFYPAVSIWDSAPGTSGRIEIYSAYGARTYLATGSQASGEWNPVINVPGEYWLQFGVWDDTKSQLLAVAPSVSENLITVTDSLAQLIQQLTITSTPLIISGQTFLILTLEHRIDPTTLEVVEDSGQTKLYTYATGDPISDGDTAQKIGILETARVMGNPQLSERIAVLGELLEELSQTSGDGWVNILASGVVDQIKWQKVYNFNDFLQYWDPARTTWHNLKVATIKSPPAGLLVKATTALIKKIVGDPFGEVENDLQNSLSSAISYYESIEDIDNTGITDYDEAYSFLSNLYYGKSKEEVAAYLNDKLFNNIVNLFDDAGPVASILTLATKVPLIGQALALLEFPKLAWEAKLATDWVVEYLYMDTLKWYENRADLLYKLTDDAKYSLELAQADDEVTSYTMKYLEELNTGYAEAAKIPQAAYDYLANLDWDSFISSLKQIILHSPGELRVYDSQGRVTGLVNGEINEEIPDSVYADETVLLFNSADLYHYEVVGMDQGTYGLEMGFREGEEVEGLALLDVPIMLGEVHKYTINGALSSGETTITVDVDSDGDGSLDATKTLMPPITLFHFSPGEVPVNKRIEFDASQSYDVDGEIVSYQWNFGDGTISTDKTTMHAYSTAGDYVIMLVVVDNDGVASSRLSSIRVQDTPFSQCFIATAAFGTPIADEIQILREFRDEYLLTNPLGQALVNLYYEISPPIANFIADHPSLKPIVRAGLLPAVAASTIVINITPVEQAAMIGLSALVALVVLVYVTRRRNRGQKYG